MNFHQSSLDQLQCAFVDYKVSGPLNLLGCSSNYSESTHALQIGALWPLQLVLYLVTSSLSFKQRSGPKPCEENAPYHNFLLVENRVKDDRRSFSSLRRRPQSALPDHFTWTLKFIKGICFFYSLFVVSTYLVFIPLRYDSILPTNFIFQIGNLKPS